MPKPVTAAELLRELEKDKEYQERLQDLEAERAEIYYIRTQDEQPVVIELKKAGFEIDNLWDLVNRGDPYPEALPILFRHRNGDYLAFTREAIYRAMTVRDATTYAPDFLHDFATERSNDLRWVIGNAISKTVTFEQAKNIRKLIDQADYGSSRSSLIDGLVRIEGQKAIFYLMEIMSDADLTAECIEALGKLRAKTAIEVLESYTSHEDAYIRKKAIGALKRIKR